LLSQSKRVINLDSQFPEDIPTEFTGKPTGLLPLCLPIASEGFLTTRFLDYLATFLSTQLPFNLSISPQYCSAGKFTRFLTTSLAISLLTTFPAWNSRSETR
jgi:hypothetical protein